MSNLVKIAAACAALGLAVPAAALAEAGGTATLSYGQLSIGDESVDILGLGYSGWATKGALSFNYQLSYRSLSEDGFSIDTASLVLDAMYNFGSFGLGAYADYTNLSFSGSSVDLTSYGLQAGYSSGPVSGRVYYGKTSVSESDADATDYGIRGGYVMPTYGIWGLYQVTDPDEGGDSLSTLGLAGAYAINPHLTLFGGYVTTEAGGSSIDALGAGLGYSFTGGSRIPVTLGVEYANISFDGSSDSFDQYKFTVSIPIGVQKGPTIPTDSIAGSVRDPRFNAISGLVLPLS